MRALVKTSYYYFADADYFTYYEDYGGYGQDNL